jgi:hypothetical protein
MFDHSAPIRRVQAKTAFEPLRLSEDDLLCEIWRIDGGLFGLDPFQQRSNASPEMHFFSGEVQP